VIRVESDGVGNGFGYWPDTSVTGYPDGTVYIPIVQHKRSGNTDYGGVTPQAIQSSLFIHTNHFQIIDQTFRNAIKKTVNGIDRYIVDGLQIFGGDCFINIFDYKRSILNYYVLGQLPSGRIPLSWQFGQSIMIPLQSDLNYADRLGNHVAQLRSYGMCQPSPALQYPTFPNGIRYNDELTDIETRDKWEEYFYDDSFSSQHAQVMFPALPDQIDLNNAFPERIRWSLKKINGETIDNYRVFKTENKQDLNKMGGIIIAIDGEKDRLYYWQQRLCGFIPVGEREMQVNQMGMPVQLGIGGEYSRIDDMSKFFGVQHRQAVIKVPSGYVFFDAIRKTWIHMDFNFGISEESIIKGLSNKFQSKVQDYMTQYDNFQQGGGICLVYSPGEKIVYGIFRDPINAYNNFIIGYNVIYQKFVSFHIFPINCYFTIGDQFYSNKGDNKFYIHAKGTPRHYYDELYESYLHVVLNPDAETIKAFHGGEMTPLRDFFNEVVYKTSDQEITEDVATHQKYYENRLGSKWLFNFPFIGTGRLRGLFLSLLFRDSDPVSTSEKQVGSILLKYIKWL